MKKIAIITHYYQSNNYGGNLQAYALCSVISRISHTEAEQICYDVSVDAYRHRKITPYRVLNKMFSIMHRIIFDADYHCAAKSIAVRCKAVREFNSGKIPHSEIVYNARNIEEANDQYDIFVTGSDQVWHPNVMCPAYLLSFVHSQNTRISYAASISCDSLDSKSSAMLRDALQDYDGISVREQRAQEIVSGLTEKKVELVLDPTLLLTAEEWNGICAKRQINEPYLFCYFLGNGKKQRKLAEKYAADQELKLVTLPYLEGEFRNCDKTFGDIQMFDVCPEKFLSLIKYADCVFTDSFHGTVFSSIYKVPFFTFRRGNNAKMESRLTTLTEILHQEERLCNRPERTKLGYIKSCKWDKEKLNMNEVDRLRELSINFLKESIKAGIKNNENQ